MSAGRDTRAMGIEYEVNLRVEAAIAGDYLDWLREHVAAMLALPGFTGASLWQVREPTVAGTAGFCVRYRLLDAAALDRYLRDQAPAMRADGLARFGDRVQADRRILWPIQASETAPDG